MNCQKIVVAIAFVSATLSVISWTYRTVLELSPYQEIWFYLITPVLFWAVFAGPLFLTMHRRKSLRVLAGILLVPTSILWALSVIVGFFGLRIH